MKIKKFIPLIVISSVNILFIPIDIFFGLNLITIIDLILALVILLIINILSGKISKDIMMINNRKLSKNEKKKLEDDILKIRDFKKWLYLSLLVSVIVLIIYLIIIL